METTSWENLRKARLENDRVLMRPIAASDREQFRAIAFDPEIWKYFVSRITTEADLDQFVEKGVQETSAGTRIVFSIILKPLDRIVGSMSYGNLAQQEKRLEIGWSWLGKEYQGTGVNGAAKYLLLEHAFESLQCERVEFKTDVLNVQARRGLQNIGASQEGVLRSYNFMPDNRRRDAVYYSILKAEWPPIKEKLRLHGRVSPPLPVAPQH